MASFYRTRTTPVPSAAKNTSIENEIPLESFRRCRSFNDSDAVDEFPPHQEGSVVGSYEITSSLDEDPHRLTTFPVPGQASAPIQRLIEWNRKNSSSTEPDQYSNSATTSSSQQYWMPDKICKVCYDCGEFFTFFRRRHHCRLCGQIFCGQCSSAFVDGVPHGFSGPVRVCNFCHDQVELHHRSFSDAAARPSLPLSPHNEQPETLNLTNDPIETLESPRLSRNDETEDHLQSLKDLYMTQLRAIVHTLLLQYENLKVSTGLSKFENEIITAAKTACTTIDPAACKTISKTDIRDFVAVKTTEREMQEFKFEYIAGIVCRKNVTHKRMRRSIENPKILLFSGGIQYERGVRMSSLDTLLEQEKDYMGILVGKILKLGPDVVFVHGTVSRQAQELLLKHDVIVIQKTKLSQLERIARQTMATILPSSDHVIQFGEESVGTCSKFTVGLNSESPAKKGGRKTTYIGLSGCNPLLGCTFHLQGPDQNILKSLKSVLRDTLYIAYNMYLEMYALNDLGQVPVQITENFFATNQFQPYSIGKLNDSIRLGKSWLHHISDRYEQCSASDTVKTVFYGPQDITLGTYIVEKCLALSPKCKNTKCTASFLEHIQSFHLAEDQLVISVESLSQDTRRKLDDAADSTTIFLDLVCTEGCSTMCRPLSPQSFKYSATKFFEMLLTNESLRQLGCGHRSKVFFVYRQVVVKMEHSQSRAWDISTRSPMPFNHQAFKDHYFIHVNDLNQISNHVFESFLEKVTTLSTKISLDDSDRASITCSSLELHLIHRDIQHSKNSFNMRIDSCRCSGDKSQHYYNHLKRDLFILANRWNDTLDKIQRLLTSKAVVSEAELEAHFGSRDGISDLLFTENRRRELNREILIGESNEIGLRESNDDQLESFVEGYKSSDSKTFSTTPPVSGPVSQSRWKSALDDFVRVLGVSNRSSWRVELPHEISSGNPGLPLGASGIITLVYDNEPSSIIAYSLNSSNYGEDVAKYKSKMSLEGEGVDSPEMFLRSREKSHVKHKFSDSLTLAVDDETGRKFSCLSYFAVQFQVLRQLLYGVDNSYTQSLSLSSSWEASGGKSGAAFFKTLDDRFVVKRISKTELQSFIDVALVYFKYMAEMEFSEKHSILARLVGLYEVHSCEKNTQYIAVHENVFYNRQIGRTFDLKGSFRSKSGTDAQAKVQHDKDFLNFTNGHALRLSESSYNRLMSAIQNDVEFMASGNLIDYSILLGIDDDSNEIIVGIIDYLRQYDLLKQMESVSKSVGMIAGQEAPTIVEPTTYKSRFSEAMKRYFLSVPNI